MFDHELNVFDDCDNLMILRNHQIIINNCDLIYMIYMMIAIKGNQCLKCTAKFR